MWLVYMLYPEINTTGSKRGGQALTARGLVRICEMQVGHSNSLKEAKELCVQLAIQTLKDRGHDTTVVGYGIRNYYAKKGEKLQWMMSIQQVLRSLKRRRDAKKAAAEKKAAAA